MNSILRSSWIKQVSKFEKLIQIQMFIQGYLQIVFLTIYIFLKLLFITLSHFTINKNV